MKASACARAGAALRKTINGCADLKLRDALACLTTSGTCQTTIRLLRKAAGSLDVNKMTDEDVIKYHTGDPENDVVIGLMYTPLWEELTNAYSKVYGMALETDETAVGNGIKYQAMEAWQMLQRAKTLEAVYSWSANKCSYLPVRVYTATEMGGFDVYTCAGMIK